MTRLIRATLGTRTAALLAFLPLLFAARYPASDDANIAHAAEAANDLLNVDAVTSDAGSLAFHGCCYFQYYYQAYYQGYYEGYYQSYYQSYYQGYYQGYYQSYYQSYYQGYYQSYYQSYYQGYYQSYYQSYYQGSYQTTFTRNASALGAVAITGSISKGSGSFLIDHPLDPENKLLYHSFLESPEAKNLYDGVAKLDANGEAVIQLPDYFVALNNEFRYQVKPITAAMPDLHVKTRIEDNVFSVAGGVPGEEISWQVTGVRHDPYILANPIIPEVKKSPDALVDIGEYVAPEVYENQGFFGIFRSLWDRIGGG